MTTNETKALYVSHAGTFATIDFRLPKQYKWNPKDDITAYELALCVPIITCGAYSSDAEYLIAALSENAQRHFEEI
ncbi:MAG TPA: hypothetical protein VMV86_06820 [Methanosarcinales archaeon]|nr:hypothetical protein [Methanosarcinales archaeon]